MSITIRSSYECGRVNQALSARLLDHIKDFEITVAKLEHQFRLGQLALQLLWYHTEKLISPMIALRDLAQQAIKSKAYGSKLLDLMLEMSTARGGDTQVDTKVYFI